MRGLIIAFEGLDQSGKQTQAERVRDRLVASGRVVELLSFPAYHTSIGFEIRQALEGTRRWRAEVMQLLYIANRYELKPRIEEALALGTIVVCDRYVASSIAYGESQGLDAAWLHDVQRYLPQPDITFLLDIAPEVSAQRKTAGRDAYERDLALLARVRDSYLRQAQARGWLRLDASRDREQIASEIFEALEKRLEHH
jgi:dTMP kinase